MNKVLEEFEDKKTLILGFAREGQSTLLFLRKYFPRKTFFIADQNEYEVNDKFTKTNFGEKYLANLSDFDVVIKSPGIPNKLSEIVIAKKHDVEFTSQTKIFFELCQGTIVGVTGTKGKSTTTALIHHILQSNKHDSILLGNIGKPCLDYLDQDFGRDKIFCFELSSHQLSDLDISPHIAVLLNIFPEHLDYYIDFQDYINAKLNITKYQNSDDYLIVNDDVPEFDNIQSLTKAKCITFSSKTAKEYRSSTNLVGEHNLLNIAASVEVAKLFGISDQDIAKSLKSFEPLETRLESIGEFKNITFVEDALATIPEATIAAINSFSGQIGSLILGGSDRGQDFSKLARKIISERIHTLVFFPTTGERIWQEIEKLKPDYPIKHFFADSMDEAVRLCFENTYSGKVCLLSTASPSFSIFKDYRDKSNQFRKSIDKYSNL